MITEQLFNVTRLDKSGPWRANYTKRVLQAIKVPRKKAEEVAKNWAAWDAKIEPASAA